MPWIVLRRMSDAMGVHDEGAELRAAFFVANA
jgi:hypothetical protein